MNNIFTKALIDYYNLIKQEVKEEDKVSDDTIDAVVWMFANLISEVKEENNDQMA